METGNEVNVIRPRQVFFNLSFGAGSATLPKNADRQMEEIARALGALSKRPVIHIHGHSDQKRFPAISLRKNKQRNRKLSRKRAATIANILKSRGIAMKRIRIHAHGDTDPFETGDTPAALAKNRRIEIEVE
ncbi:MAG: OmpA family protein [Gammaproteobacteria bacterium]|nr:OmpA family protein [Gammaproteobacteria bacterium]